MLISYRVLFSTILSAPIMQFCIKDVLSGRENLFVFLYKTNQIDHETVLSFHGRIDWYRSSGRPLQTHCQLSFVVTRSLIGFFKIILLYLSLPSFGKAYILRKCFSPSLAVKLDNLQNQKQGTGRLTLCSSIDSGLVGVLCSLYSISGGCGVRFYLLVLRLFRTFC